MEAIEPGNIVKLKSGGIEMTVDSVKSGTNGRKLVCVWFTGDQFHREEIDRAALIAKDSPPAPDKSDI